MMLRILDKRSFSSQVTFDPIDLSCADVLNVMPFGIFYAYESQATLGWEDLCHSLEETLRHYPSMCGSVKKVMGGYRVFPTGKGVEIIKAEVEDHLSSLDLSRPDKMPQSLYSAVNVGNQEEYVGQYIRLYYDHTDGRAGNRC